MTDLNREHEATFETCVCQSDLRAIEAPKRKILDAIREHNYDDSALFAMQLALEEALTNAVKHGNCCDPSKSVTVRFCVDDQRAVVVVRDEGEGFEPDDVPDPTQPDRLPVPNGRGIMLLRAYMDEIEYRDNGRELYMVKVRKSATGD